MTRPLPTGPAAPPKAEAGPRRGSDASQCSDRSRVSLSNKEAVHIHNVAIEDCAKIAERYTNPRGSFSTGAMARDIAADIRKLAKAPDAMPDGTDPKDFPWGAFA